MNDLGKRCAVGVLMIFGLSSGSAWAQLDPVVCIPKKDFNRPSPAPLPTIAGEVNGARVYEGATPPGLDPARPILVFVHGLHGQAASWGTPTEYYGRNDMYDTVFAGGYKSFFVDLLDATGPAPDPFDNGLLLRDQIAAIAAYQGVDRVNLIAHSKGGVDSNVAALTSPLVDTIVTLSGAHGGSPLADLAQTDWLEWLAILLGSNDAGTKFLQTGCMAQFRSLADSMPGNDSFSYYTTAGTSWGPALSALSFGGLYLSGACGANDGLVCVADAKHPLARDAQGVPTGEHRLIWDQSGDFELDHDNVRMGNAFQDFIEIPFFESRDCYVPVLGSVEPYFGVFHHAQGARPDASRGTIRDRARDARHERNLSQILRGGPVPAGGAVERFPVEDGAQELRVAVLVGSAAVRARLVAPNGNVLALPRPHPAGSEIFAGAHTTVLSIREPAAGSWSLHLTGPRPDAFALLADIDSSLNVAVDGSSGAVLAPGTAFRFHVASPGSSTEVRTSIRRTSSLGPPRSFAPQTRLGAGEHEVGLAQPGVYNLGMTVTGRTPAGWEFERSAVFSVALSGTSPIPLPEACK